MSNITELKEEYSRYEEAIDFIIDFSVKAMLHNKSLNGSAEHEWLCFNNTLELIRNNVMERLEREDYFK
jgi:hypothetical protein